MSRFLTEWVKVDTSDKYAPQHYKTKKLAIKDTALCNKRFGNTFVAIPYADYKIAELEEKIRKLTKDN
jgi:hypothetical protein